MSNLSSINFKKSNAIQTQHNDRILPPTYLIGGNIEINRSSKEAEKLKNEIIKQAIETYTERTKQKFQSKSYEWSAVVNIKETTTLQDLEKLAEHFFKKYGFQCYQIAIHRDEGHINENGEKQINHHAHMEFITLDKETGKNNYRREIITPKVLREIQTEVAEILQMQRGVDKRISKAQRVEPRIYARMKEEEKKEIKKVKKENNQSLNQFFNTLDEALEIDTTKTTFSNALEIQKKEILKLKDVKAEFEALRKEMIALGVCDATDYKTLREATAEALKKTKDKSFSEKDLNESLEKLRKDLEKKYSLEQSEMALKSTNQEKTINTLNNNLNTLKIDLNAKNEKIKVLEEENGKFKHMATTYKQLYENLKAFIKSYDYFKIEALKKAVLNMPYLKSLSRNDNLAKQPTTKDEAQQAMVRKKEMKELKKMDDLEL